MVDFKEGQLPEALLSPQMAEKAARQLAPLTLAFVGDAVYELALRTMIVQDADRSPKDLQRASSHFAKAVAQAKMVDGLLPLFAEDEAEVYQRGRNTKTHTMAKHASVAEYRAATGLEAVFGYLYLTRREARLLELIQEGVSYLEREEFR